MIQQGLELTRLQALILEQLALLPLMGEQIQLVFQMLTKVLKAVLQQAILLGLPLTCLFPLIFPAFVLVSLLFCFQIVVVALAGLVLLEFVQVEMVLLPEQLAVQKGFPELQCFQQEFLVVVKVFLQKELQVRLVLLPVPFPCLF